MGKFIWLILSQYFYINIILKKFNEFLYKYWQNILNKALLNWKLIKLFLDICNEITYIFCRKNDKKIK
jgi:hypothetical protein